MASRSQIPTAMAQGPQASISQPQTDREWKLSTLLAKYKMALDTAQEDLRTAASSAVTVMSLNEELTAKVVNLEKKLKKVQEERQNAIIKLQEKLEESKTSQAITTDEESTQLQEENTILKSIVDTLQENIEQYYQEISTLEEQVSWMQESGAQDATHMREAQAQVTSLQAEVDSWEVELQCMHHDLTTV